MTDKLSHPSGLQWPNVPPVFSVSVYMEAYLKFQEATRQQLKYGAGKRDEPFP